jgi:adenylate cyclase
VNDTKIPATRSAREIWEANQDLERIEFVRRCIYCGARQDRHNLQADMEYYGYASHPFEYQSHENISQ